MAIFMTADLHLGHKASSNGKGGIIMLDKRPFASIEEHDAKIIDNINATCRPNDDLYILGDFSFRTTPEEMHNFTNRIKCRMHMVWGNHDDNLRKLVRRYLGLFHSYHDALYLRWNGQKVYLHHYACRTWRSSQHGSWHLYGHSHGRLPSYGKSLDVSISCHEYMPWSFEQIKVFMDARPLECPDHRIREVEHVD